MVKIIFLFGFLILPIALVAEATNANPLYFSSSDVANWQTKSFKGNTTYQLQQDGSLCAESNGAASAKFLKVDLDLSKTPWLNWSWQVKEGIRIRGEKTKQGDDYPARIYVVFENGWAFWQTKAINYVWSSEQPLESHWPNPFTGNAQMVALQSGIEKTGQWIKQRRNVLEDYQKLFGENPDSVIGIAIMTDMDNSGDRATACYGDIWFSSKAGE